MPVVLFIFWSCLGILIIEVLCHWKKTGSHRPHEAQDGKKTKVQVLQSFSEGKQNNHRRRYGDNLWCTDWRKGYPETATPADPSHIQTLNPDNISDIKNAWYSCLLRDSARVWQKIQREMFKANHWTENGVPNGGVRERTDVAEVVCNSIGRTTMSTNQIPPPRAPRD